MQLTTRHHERSRPESGGPEKLSTSVLGSEVPLQRLGSLHSILYIPARVTGVLFLWITFLNGYRSTFGVAHSGRGIQSFLYDPAKAVADMACNPMLCASGNLGSHLTPSQKLAKSFLKDHQEQ